MKRGDSLIQQDRVMELHYTTSSKEITIQALSYSKLLSLPLWCSGDANDITPILLLD